jgi:rubrerythrin
MIVELAEKRSKADNLPHLTLCPANLQSLKRNGVQEWLNQQERRWKCSKCGRKVYWYSESCPDCGTEFFDAVKEARSLGRLEDWP